MVHGSAGMRMKHVPRYEVFEITLESTASYGNPFTDIAVTAEFTSPYGRKLVVWGFYDGDNAWKIRFAPDEFGLWHYATSASDGSNTELHGKNGIFNCVSSSNKGFIRVDPSSKCWFSYSNGSPFFGLDDTCYGMVNCIGDSQRIEYLEHGYWTKSHPMGAVDVNGAFILPKPEHMLLKKLIFLNGNAARGRNADGGPMVIFRKRYDHGLGMRSGDSVTFNIPAGVNGFMANVAMDDAYTGSDRVLQFAVVLDVEEVWRSNQLRRYESQMVHIKLPGKGRLTLSVDGLNGALANWGGAKFIVSDPDMQVCDRNKRQDQSENF